MNGAASVQDDAGATDNRMYWALDQFPPTQQMQDGQTYRMTLVMRQTSGGQGEIVSIEDVEPATPGDSQPEEQTEEAGEGDGAPAETPTDMSGRGAGTGNPAIDKLLATGPKQ